MCIGFNTLLSAKCELRSESPWLAKKEICVLNSKAVSVPPYRHVIRADNTPTDRVLAYYLISDIYSRQFRNSHAVHQPGNFYLLSDTGNLICFRYEDVDVGKRIR